MHMAMRATIMSTMLALAAWSPVAAETAAAPDSASTATVMQRIELASLEPAQGLLALAWHNPAINQYRRSFTMSEVGLSFTSRHESTALHPQQGDGEHIAAFDATTYIKHKSQTLWGRAYYNNGRIDGIEWNETSDIDIVYPYLLADSAGGKKMNVERYSFGGGYASRKGRLSWGASIGYTAGLYYRNVDPRPRNVTARLSALAGLGYRLAGDYVGAVSLGFMKYRQSNDIAFYSELGNEKIFHLTGLVNDYNRFAGSGYSTYYNGRQWSTSLSLHPADNHGFSATVAATQLGIDNVLADLNKLPMAHTDHKTVAAEAGWLAAGWGLKAHVSATRRKGTENVFGDPAGSVYLQIGSLDRYLDQTLALGLAGLWEKRWGNYALMLRPSVDYSHRLTRYNDPESHTRYNDLAGTLRLTGGATIGATFSTLTLGTRLVSPVESQLHLATATSQLQGLQRLVEAEHAWLSKTRRHLEIDWATSVKLSSRYALRARLCWEHGTYAASITSNQFFASTTLIF